MPDLPIIDLRGLDATDEQHRHTVDAIRRASETTSAATYQWG